MGKPNGKRFRLSEMREKRAKALGGRHVEIEDDDGNIVVQIPRMGFWDAATYEEIIESGVAMRDLGTLERIMEPEEFGKLQELGLELGDLRDLIEEVMKDVKRPESQGSSTL
ncbi:hypothetical protein ACFHW2_11820 [Actinomadura sp. LOL_016]|uniref:hypothetical protein n=1 Tax=unclassified Actinomadura TaxID=2626254 RepID=UPI003A80C4F5